VVLNSLAYAYDIIVYPNR